MNIKETVGVLDPAKSQGRQSEKDTKVKTLYRQLTLLDDMLRTAPAQVDRVLFKQYVEGLRGTAREAAVYDSQRDAAWADMQGEVSSAITGESRAIREELATKRLLEQEKVAHDKAHRLARIWFGIAFVNFIAVVSLLANTL